MQLSNIPGKLVLPFANGGSKNEIPVASQIGITPGAASLTDGFPPLTMTPVAAGGVPPSGLDMNGILYEISAIIRWANAGGGYPFDATFATDTNVNGYPKGARIMRADGLGYWFNTVENNVTDPESAGAAAAGWVPDFTTGVAAVTMASANVTLTPAQYGKPLIVITGTLTTDLNLIFPSIVGQWLVINNTTGNFTITAKTAAGTGVALSNTINQIAGDATNIYSTNSFLQSGTGAVVRSMNDKAKESVSVKDFGVKGDGSDEWTNINKAWLYCLANGKDLYFPAGVYSSGIKNMPFKNTDYPATSLLDCGNIMIFGDGPATILRSDSVAGADVLNLYSLKNLHIRNISVTASLSGSAAGSNGCSIVGGFDNITVDGLWAYNMPYVDHGTYLDGGKAFTIQTGTPATECGTIKATRIYAKGCVFGADVSIDLVNWGGKKHAVDIDIVAEDCYVAAVFSAGAATGALSEGMTTGIKITGQAINCQQDAQIGRAHGIFVDLQVITNKSAAARRLNPSGGAWASYDNIVTALICSYAKNSIIRITGDKGGCDYGCRIGGATAGSSGMNGATEFCDIYLDFGNQSTVADFDLIDNGGNTIRVSNLYISNAMAATLPVDLYLAANANTVQFGSQFRFNSPVINGDLKFAYDDGITSYNKLSRSGLTLFAQQTGGSSADVIVFGVKDHAGNVKFQFRNDGYMSTAGRGTASAVATIKGVLPIYTEANALWGYVPVYTTYTP